MNPTFSVGDKVTFTARDNKAYTVNFRGYIGTNEAVIVGKPEDRIDQMKVDVSQLSLLTPHGRK
jgi:plastocyanin